MSLTLQEVPEFCDSYFNDIKMNNIVYERTLSDILSEQDEEQSSVGNTITTTDIKIEDSFTPLQYQRITASPVIPSPSITNPINCDSYNNYTLAPQVVPCMASPSNVYANSPAGGSNYSTSSLGCDSPQYPMQFDDAPPPYMAERQSPYQMPPPPHVVPQGDYLYYGYSGYNFTGKRRLRDDELTPHEYEKRRLRRERNKEAALRCRNRRRERIETLEQETSELEAENKSVEREISELQRELKELKDVLAKHKCKPDDVKVVGESSTSTSTEESASLEPQCLLDLVKAELAD